MKTTWKHLLKLISKSLPLRKLEHPEVEMLGEQVATQRLLATQWIVHSTNIYGVLSIYRAEEQEQRLPKKKGGDWRRQTQKQRVPIKRGKYNERGSAESRRSLSEAGDVN